MGPAHFLPLWVCKEMLHPVCCQGACLEATAGAYKLSKVPTVTVTFSHDSTPLIRSIILTSYYKCIKIWQSVITILPLNDYIYKTDTYLSYIYIYI